MICHYELDYLIPLKIKTKLSIITILTVVQVKEFGLQVCYSHRAVEDFSKYTQKTKYDAPEFNCDP